MRSCFICTQMSPGRLRLAFYFINITSRTTATTTTTAITTMRRSTKPPRETSYVEIYGSTKGIPNKYDHHFAVILIIIWTDISLAIISTVNTTTKNSRLVLRTGAQHCSYLRKLSQIHFVIVLGQEWIAPRHPVCLVVSWLAMVAAWKTTWMANPETWID